MIKYTINILKALYIFLFRVFIAISGLVLFSSIKAVHAFFFSHQDEGDHEEDENQWTSVNDLSSAQSAFARGEVDEATIAHYWATEDQKK